MKIRFSTLPLILLVAFLFIGPLVSNAQLPGMGIYFQAIARDKMENPAKDRKIYVQTNLIQSNNNSNALLTELHITKSDGMGVFGLSIGLGNRTGGTASNLLAIPWEKGPFLLNVKIAIEPISPLYNWDYTKEWIDLGTSPFGSVPYALYAGNGSSNDKKLNISDTAAMLAPYAKAVASIINNPITPLVALDSVNQKIQQKVNIKDSNWVYVTPYQLSLKTFDTSSLSNRINNKLNLSDTISLLNSYSKQTQVNNLLALKVNIADTSAMLGNRIGRDTLSLSNRINQKLNIADSIYSYVTPSKLKGSIIDTTFLSNRINTKLNFSDTAYMLRNYAKTNNFSTLAFTGNYNDLINKPAVIANIVNTVNGLTGDVLVNKNTMSISNVDNTSDANKPISILTNAALNNKVDKTAINVANGIPSLDANTKIPSYLLPAISFTSVTIANSTAQMQSIGTTALKGTVAVRTDVSKTYILSVDNSSNVNDWVEILNPGAPVQSVNGKLANVSLTTSDIAEGSNEYFTQSKSRLSLTANGPINYNALSGLFSADTSTSNYSLVTRYALQQQNITTIASLNGKVNLSDTANMLYPYVKNANYTAALLNKVNVSDTSVMLGNRIARDTIALSNRINLKENAANKSADINLDAASIVKFPTTSAVKRYVDSVAIVLNSNIVASNSAIVLPDASTFSKGIIQLAGDLSGIATTPIIANNAINTAKIMDGAITTLKVLDASITDSKIATGISASKVGLGNVNNTSDLNKPISTLTQNAINNKLNSSDTATMLSAYLTSIQNLNATKLNKNDTAAMLNNYQLSIQLLGTNKLNISDTANLLIAYRNYQTSLNNNKLNKSDTSAMLSNYLSSIHNLSSVKLNNSDTSAMLSNYLSALNTKELLSSKSNDATLGGGSPSNTLYPTQAAVKQYITNNAGSGSMSATSLVGVVPIANGGSGQSTANAAFNAFAPTQTNNSGKFLTTDGTNTSWASSGGGWSLTGNASMVDGTNFIGTTDAQALNFRVNNLKSGRIDASAVIGQTSFGYGAGANALNNSTSPFAGTRNTGIGYQAMYNTTYGKENVVLGYQALYNNFSASGSTAIGYQAMLNAYNISTSSSYNTYNTAVGYQALLGSTTLANNNGISNTAVGHQAIRSNASGANNTALGYISLYANTTGNDNTSIGYNALSSINTGSSNTAIGANADVTGNVSNSTVIGYGATTANANTIQLGNGTVTNVNTAGSITAGEDVSLKHLKGTTAKPTVTFYGVNVGIADAVISGTDLGGNIQFTTRSSTSKDYGIFSINFAKAYSSNNPVVVLTATNAAASVLPIYINASSGFFYVFPSSTAPTPNTTYSWNYIVVQ